MINTKHLFTQSELFFRFFKKHFGDFAFSVLKNFKMPEILLGWKTFFPPRPALKANPPLCSPIDMQPRVKVNVLGVKRHEDINAPDALVSHASWGYGCFTLELPL